MCILTVHALTKAAHGLAPSLGSELLLFKCCFTVGLLGTGAQDGHLDSHTASEL